MNKDTRLSDVLHVLLHLGHVKAPQTSEVLAKSMQTNPAVFRRTMAGLRNAGIVRSDKGHGGGWVLVRPLQDLTLLDVYQALESPSLFAFGMRNEDPDCQVEQCVNRMLADTIAEARALFIERFGQVTLADLMPEKVSDLTVHDGLRV